jgi:rubrerythrin
MKTSVEWWNEVKASPEKTIKWLKSQYYGEMTAADRINQYVVNYIPDSEIKVKNTINLIIEQERKHASWVLELLRNRGIQIDESVHGTDRYWDEVLPNIDEYKTLEYASAVASHAEQMRLERIKVIADDNEAPKDIRDVFSKILNEEIFHTKAFASIAGDNALSESAKNHAKGVEALGLIL